MFLRSGVLEGTNNFKRQGLRISEESSSEEVNEERVKRKIAKMLYSDVV